METHARSLVAFLEQNPTYNNDVAFLIDMKRRSGLPRFFIYDVNTRKSIDSGLVAHGSGSETGVAGKLKFSNTANSHCTSLGKYRIGAFYNGRFGKAYTLHGLDSTNSNALARHIVLHAYKDMPYGVQGVDVCNSLGCPMVNDRFYQRLQRHIDAAPKPIIMEIFYE